MRLLPARYVQLGAPVFLHPSRQGAAEIEKRLPRGPVLARPEDFDWVEAALLPEQGADIVVHRRKPRGVPRALERLEVQLGQVDAVPIEPRDQPFYAGRDGAKTVAVGQVHELAPVELSVLKHRGLLAPLGMVVPELL